MGKLGKKARKFAKKNLQSVLKQRRKTKALFKKKSSKGDHNDDKEKLVSLMECTNERLPDSRVNEFISLDAMFAENDNNDVADKSDSDGYLFEDSSWLNVEKKGTEKSLDETATSTYFAQNENLFADLAILKKKLGRLKRKDPEFSNFLETYSTSSEAFPNGDLYSDEDRSDQEELGEGGLATVKGKLLTTSIVKSWFQMIREDGNQSAFISLLNAYRTACHYGAGFGHRIDNSETFCNILVFTLFSADDTFRSLLQLSSSNCTKETIFELKKASKLEFLKPLIKSYMRSTLFLLDQVTDRDILAFALTRFRSSLIFLVAFPSLVQRLIKVSVQLWATSGGYLSTASLLIIRDTAAMFSTSYFTTCLSKTMVAFISRSRVTEITDIKHMQFLRDSVVDLCSLDVQKSYVRIAASISQLSKLMQCGLQTKTKVAVKRICSWEYVNCIDLLVRFISTNIHDHDLQSSFLMTIQLIYALALMFPGPRYFPLRLKCIEWLNCLSSSSGNFIPLVSLVLDILEYKVVKENRKAQINFNIASVLKLPKHYLKSKHFQEECARSAIEQLSLHFAQWSSHISFPDLACIPLICMRKFTETTTSESLRRLVKHLIDQVEQNVNFVQKKRDEVSFSPNNHQSVDSFLQLEKSSLNNSFTNYYKSLQEKAAERSKRGQ